jgi:hypothetical protein
LTTGVIIEGAGEPLEREDSQVGVGVKGGPGMYQRDGGGREMLLADLTREIGVTLMGVEEGTHSGAQRGSPAIFGSRGIVTGVKIACICMHIPLHRMLR